MATGHMYRSCLFLFIYFFLINTYVSQRSKAHFPNKPNKLILNRNIYTRIVDLLNKLKVIFAPNKLIAQYRGELANIYKLPTETILKYAGRVKDLKSAILDENKCQGKDLSTFMEEVDEEVLEVFINGLPSDIITCME